jgi:hypothetical protein
MDKEPSNEPEKLIDEESTEGEKDKPVKTVYELVLERLQNDPNLSYGDRTVLHALAVIGVDLAKNIHVLAQYVATLNNGLSNAQGGTPNAAGQMAFTFPGNNGNESTV